MLSKFDLNRIKMRFQSGKPTLWTDVKKMIDEIERLHFENEQLKETLKLATKESAKEDNHATD